MKLDLSIEHVEELIKSTELGKCSSTDLVSYLTEKLEEAKEQESLDFEDCLSCKL